MDQLAPPPPPISDRRRREIANSAAAKATKASRSLALGAIFNGIDGLRVEPTGRSPVIGEGGPAEGGQSIVALESFFARKREGSAARVERAAEIEVLALRKPVPVTGGAETWLPLLEEEVRRTLKARCCVDAGAGSQPLARDVRRTLAARTAQGVLLALRLAFTHDARAIMRSWREEAHVAAAYEAAMEADPEWAEARLRRGKSAKGKVRPTTARSVHTSARQRRLQEGKVDTTTAVSLADMIAQRNNETNDVGDGSNEVVLFSGLIEDGLGADEEEMDATMEEGSHRAAAAALPREALRHCGRQQRIYEQLAALARACNGESGGALQRTKVELALTVQLHQRDVLIAMLSSRDASEAAWAAQATFSWYHGGRDSLGHGSCVVSMGRAKIRHGFYYVGAREMASARLFVTPLTERCQAALVASVGRGAGGSSAQRTLGAALCGAGGTALLASFAAAVGRPLINIDCAGGSHDDPRAMSAALGRALRAACAGGLWLNFVEPERLGIAHAAKLASQLASIAEVKHSSWADWQWSSRRRGDRGVQRTLWGSAVRLDAGEAFPLDVDVAAFATCATRSSLFDRALAPIAVSADALAELKTLWRSISLVRPSATQTLAVALHALGWSRADSGDFDDAVLSAGEVLDECARLGLERSGADGRSGAVGADGTLLLGALLAALRVESDAAGAEAQAAYVPFVAIEAAKKAEGGGDDGAAVPIVEAPSADDVARAERRLSAVVHAGLRRAVPGRLLEPDRAVFDTLLSEAFPLEATTAAAVTVLPADEAHALLRGAAVRLGLHPGASFLAAAVDLLRASDTIGAQMDASGCAGGVPPLLIVGPSGCGKSTLLRVVLEALSARSLTLTAEAPERYGCEVVYTSAVAPSVLLGSAGVGTSRSPLGDGLGPAPGGGGAWDHSVCMEGQRGMIGVVWRRIVEHEAELAALADAAAAEGEVDDALRERNWLVCDGPIAPAAADSLCAALGLGHVGAAGAATAITVPYPPAPRAPVASGTRVVFETASLAHASPALIARSLIVAVPRDALSVNALAATWLHSFEHERCDPDAVRHLIKPLMHAHLEGAVAFVAGEAESEGGPAAGLACRSAFDAVRAAPGAQRSAVALAQRVAPVFTLLSTMLHSSDLSQSPDDLATEIKRIFVYALAWGLGSAMAPQGRDALNAWITAQRGLFLGLPGAVDKKKKSKKAKKAKGGGGGSSPPGGGSSSPHTHKGSAKPTGNVFHYCLDPDTIEWAPWVSPFHDMYGALAKMCGSKTKSSSSGGAGGAKGKKALREDASFVPPPPPPVRVPKCLPAPPHSWDLLVPTLHTARDLFVAKQLLQLPVPLPPIARGATVPPNPPPPTPVLLIAPPGCGKTSTAMLLFNEQLYPRRDLMTRVVAPHRIALAAGCSGTALQHALEHSIPGLMRSVVGGGGGEAHAHAAHAKPTLLFLDDLNLAEPSALEIARQLVECGGLRSVASRALGQRRTKTAAGTRFLATASASSLVRRAHASDSAVASQVAEGGGANAPAGAEGGVARAALWSAGGRRALRHFFAIALEVPSAALDVAAIVAPMTHAAFGASSHWTERCADIRATRGLAGYAEAEDMDTVALALGVATGAAWEWVREQRFAAAPDRWMASCSLRAAGRIARGLVQASPGKSNGAVTLMKLWRHEAAHVFCDALRVASERERVCRKLDTIAKKYLEPLVSVKAGDESEGLALLAPPTATAAKEDEAAAGVSGARLLPLHAPPRVYYARNASVPWVNFHRSLALLSPATLDSINALETGDATAKGRAGAAASSAAPSSKGLLGAAAKAKASAKKIKRLSPPSHYAPVAGYDDTQRAAGDTSPVAFHMTLLALLAKFNERCAAALLGDRPATAGDGSGDGDEGEAAHWRSSAVLGPIHAMVDVPFATSVAAAARVLQLPCGHLVLAGQRRSGRTDVARLAAFAVWGEHEIASIECDWGDLARAGAALHGALRAACRRAATLRQPTTIILRGALFDDIVSAREGGGALRKVLGPLDAVIRGGGEIPLGLYTAEESVALHQAIHVDGGEGAAAAAQRVRVARERVAALVHVVVVAALDDVRGGAGLLRANSAEAAAAKAHTQHQWLLNRFHEYPGLAATPFQWIAAPLAEARRETARSLLAADEEGAAAAGALVLGGAPSRVVVAHAAGDAAKAVAPAPGDALKAPVRGPLRAPAAALAPLPSELQRKLATFFAAAHADALALTAECVADAAASGKAQYFHDEPSASTLAWCVEQYRVCFVRRSRWATTRKQALCASLRALKKLESDTVHARAQLAHEQKYAVQSQSSMDAMLGDIELASISANQIREDADAKRAWCVAIHPPICARAALEWRCPPPPPRTPPPLHRFVVSHQSNASPTLRLPLCPPPPFRCASEKSRIDAANAEAATVLEAARPFLQKADAAVNDIRPGDLNDLRRLTSLPDSFKLHIDTLLLLQQMPIDDVAPTTVLLGSGRTKARVKFLANSWDHGARALVQDASFLRNLFHFNEYSRDEINAETIELMEPYVVAGVSLTGRTTRARRRHSTRLAHACSFSLSLFHSVSRCLDVVLTGT